MSKSVKKREKKYTPKPINRDPLGKVQPMHPDYIQFVQIQLLMFLDRLKGGRLPVEILTLDLIEVVTERIMVACEYLLSVSPDPQGFKRARSVLRVLAEIVDKREEKQHPRYIATYEQLETISVEIPWLLMRMRDAKREDISAAQRKAILAARKHK